MFHNYDEALDLVLDHEGGFVNHPKDPGGATNKGVTQRVYDAYRRSIKQGTRSVRHITSDEVETIYRRQYWDRVEGDKLPSGVDYAVFDYAINSGTDRAEKEIQRVVGVTADGQIGMVTLDAINKFDPADLIEKLCDRRLAFMKRIRHRQTKELLWKTFGKGWGRRVAGVRKHALAMATTTPVTKPVPSKPAPKSKGGWAQFITAILKLFGRK